MSGEAAFVSALTTGLSTTNLWDTVSVAAPLIIIGVLFALGYRIVKRTTNGISKGKAKQ